MSETEHEQHDGTTFEAPAQPDEQPDEEEEAAEHEHAAGGGPSEADEQPEPASEASLDEHFGKLGRSATTWRNRISTVMGEDAQHLVACELCLPEIPGFHWPAELEAQKPRNDTHAALLAVLMAPEQPDYRPAPNARGCETCGAYGLVLSGSKVPGQELVECPTCKRKGYVGFGTAATNGTAEDSTELVAVAAPGPATPQEDVDPWGSPRLMLDGQPNPNYGRMIQFKDPNLP